MVSNILRALQAIQLVREIRNVRNRSDRRWWIRPSNQKRATEGFYEMAFPLMTQRDPEYFVRCTRMSPAIFDTLLVRIKHRIQKFSIRKPVKPECRLFLTLMYLAHGSSIFQMSRLFRLGVTTVRRIIQEVTTVLWDVLKDQFMPEVTTEKWVQCTNEFEHRWNMPHCCAAVDGKHVTITCPPNSGSLFYNYKKQYSVVLMAMCDANYNFIAVDIGAYGGNADGSVFANSGFGSRLLRGELGLPQPTALSNGNVIPYFIVGDAAFPLKSNLMRPYPGRNLEPIKENFNFRLSRARRTIENAFGILVARWRILLAPLHLRPEAAVNIIKSTVILHNFIKSCEGQQYASPSFVDHIDDNGEIITPGGWRLEADGLEGVNANNIQRGNNACRNAIHVRDVLAEYLHEHEIP